MQLFDIAVCMRLNYYSQNLFVMNCSIVLTLTFDVCFDMFRYGLCRICTAFVHLPIRET